MNYELPYLFLSFYVTTSNMSLAYLGNNTSEKQYDSVPYSLVFIRASLPSWCVQRKVWFKQEGWPIGAVSARLPRHLPNTYLTLALNH